ncbi:MAG: hypothetical protein FWD60_03115 [Candidatus Azobacteroides sp.]|nr:hypothetical protein [Candidatus Azobacteroides sp.]
MKKRVFPDKQLFIMVFDRKFLHGGLADRLKGIISTFHYCLCKGIEFRINHTYPFNLTDYLLPNEYNWKLRYHDKVSHHLFETKCANWIGTDLFKRLININTKKQIHCYASRNVISELNTYYQTNYEWGELFEKLFKLNPDVEKEINYHKNAIGSKYIACQFRFLALLGDFNEYDDPVLMKQEQEALIKKCLKVLTDLKNKYNIPILVTSDSITFISRVSEIEGIYTLPGKPVHIDCVNPVNSHEYMKTFIDFFMLSGAQKIYSAFTIEMYQSEFPLYAAKLNNVPFEKILIE